MNPLEKFLPLLVYTVNYCPRNELEWQNASTKLNCTKDTKLPYRYHCAPDHERNNLLEFCYDAIRILVPKGRCLELADSRTIDTFDCVNILPKECPRDVYFSDQLYKHQACTDINTHDSCFRADPKCPEENRATSRKLESTTLDLKETKYPNNQQTNAADSNVSEIVAWVIAGVCILVIAIFVVWKCSQHKRNVERDHEQNKDIEMETTEKTPFIVQNTDREQDENDERNMSEKSGFAVYKTDHEQNKDIEMETTKKTPFIVQNTDQEKDENDERNMSEKSGFPVYKTADKYEDKNDPMDSPKRTVTHETDQQEEKIKTDSLVVSIDIGSTYSGYSLSSYENFIKDPLDILSQSWKGGIISTWKTPTTVLLDKYERFLGFGYEAEDYYSDLVDDGQHEDHFYFHRFKMSLFYQGKTDGKHSVLRDVRGKSLSAMKVFKHSIKFLKNNALLLINDMKLKRKMDDIFWVLTVPAIWDKHKREFMIDAAVEADIPRKQLIFYAEGEAVSLYFKYLPLQRHENSSDAWIGTIKEGERYMVLDAGGGTFDTTCYEMEGNGILREIEKATGGPWGGIDVDKEFEKMLERIVGKETIKIYKEKHTAGYLELFRNFEFKKRLLKSKNNVDIKNITIRVPQTLQDHCKEQLNSDLNELISKTSYKNILEMENEKLRISIALFSTLFEHVCKKIIEHIQRNFVQGTNVIVMVGGFSESEFLQDRVRKTFPECKVLIPPDAGLAVLKGAVLFGHQPHSFQICNTISSK